LPAPRVGPRDITGDATACAAAGIFFNRTTGGNFTIVPPIS
jgi:hypothetical protein